MAVLDPPRRRLTITTAVGAAVVLVAGLASARTLAPTPPRHPQAWDPRVADLAGFVERERGLAFEHPVFVDFLSEDRFRDEVTANEGDLTVEDRTDIERSAQLLRATGLVDGTFDLLESTNQLSGEGVVAFYDPDRERITVRGTELTSGVRLTLVHELTHALQDQRFDLSRLGMLPTDGENGALLALVEGDAIRMENAWARGLDETQRGALDDEITEEVEGADLTGVPGPLVALFSAPYALGGPLVEVVFDQDGQQGVDDALRDPPTTDEHLLDPFTYLDGDQAVPVVQPSIDPGDTFIEGGDLGAVTWFLVLAEHLDPRQALTAVDGWGGDAFAVFERDGRTCLRSAFRGDTPADTDEMATALQAWVLAAPGNEASVARSDAVVQLETCDPGAGKSAAASGGAEDAMIYPVTRTYFALSALQSGAPLAVARCVAAAFVQSFTTDELIALDTTTADPALLDERTRLASDACRDKTGSSRPS